MKKWGFFLFLLLCLGFVVGNTTSIFQDEVVVQDDKDHLDYRESPESVQNKEITEDQIYQGNLLLVNNEYPVRQESVKSDVVNLFKHGELSKGYGVFDTDIHLSEDVAQKFSEMVDAAEKDGVHQFLISSGYRDFEEQNRLYQEMGSNFALPAGYSEHNFGLSLDVGSTQKKMSEAPEGKWIEKNAWKYGFVLRYPKDKTDVTGIQYEPWHIRYVGLPHSAIMKEKNLVLEEYLNYLKEEKDIFTSINGEKYTVSYYPVSHSVTIKVPVNLYYEISGNNMDGVIVTVSE